ncbi:hypothetical protein GCM10009775_00450 [Microbacterium aoyamense]|uniref:Endolytic murein transglycosylase n=1 Tax=Microbacterium aoyamense TaxID=344166 RepID=A0ABN2P3W5_9MICO|nr:endolytic transglycosylase MltG [Microbacterium aoyamense]
MPDPRNDDPFADLFGKLPDPRARRIDGDSGTSEPVTPTGATPPLSRREAREAAARAATGEQAVTPSAAEPAPTPSAPETESSAVPDSGGAESAPVALRSSSTPAAVPLESAPVTASALDDTDWLLAASGRDATAAAAGSGYARSSTTATIPAAEPDLEDLFTGARSTDELGREPVPKNKKRRRIGGWIALGVVLVILGGLTAGGLYVWNTYEDKIREVMGWEEPKDYEDGLANGEAMVTIASGDVTTTISNSLYEAGVTKTPEAFYDYLIEEELNPTFYPGVYKMQLQMTSAAALAALEDPANKMENTAQLREGLTVAQSLPLLAEGTGIPLEEFQAAVADPTVYGVPLDPAVAAAGGQPLEGWLFPATYTFDPGVTAQDVVQTLVNRTIQSLDSAGVPEADRQRVLTEASIIQREARTETDMKKVATVINNRMDPGNQETFGLLQMDSTAQYGYGEMHDGTVSSSEEALNDPNPWNTYVNTGLPVGPIANPGDVAIQAVMNPEPGPWFYFVTVNLNTGETVFSATVDEHNQAVAQWIEWCKANPDAGC